jgi:hypothetical protein
MNIGYCLRGISEEFEKSAKNIKEYMIHDMEKHGHTVQVFLNTYHSSQSIFNSLINQFMPVKILLNKMRTGNSMIDIIPRQFIECIDMILAYENEKNCQFDIIIITRFDITFNKPFSEYNINFEKLNMECMFIPDYNSGDNYFLIPRKWLNSSKLAIENLIFEHNNSHQSWRYFEKYMIPCHYICGETTKRNPNYDVMFKFTRYINLK